METEIADEVAVAFGLGERVGQPAMAATSWAAHNIVWRFEAGSGTWAVKEIGREPGRQIEEAAAIEIAAYRAGISCPQPKPTRAGSWLAQVAGRSFRCHRWVAGECPTTTLTDDDAWQAGRSIGRLHSLSLPCEDSPEPPKWWGESHWRRVAGRGEEAKLGWSRHLAAVVDRITAVERDASEWFKTPRRWVVSHRDVRPDNALRTLDGLVLVDWDAAGPVVAGREIATALRWWTPHEGAFIAGYTDAAGDVDLQEGSGEDGGLLGWLDQNVRLALDDPGSQIRQTALTALLQDMFPL